MSLNPKFNFKIDWSAGDIRSLDQLREIVGNGNFEVDPDNTNVIYTNREWALLLARMYRAAISSRNDPQRSQNG